MGNFRSGRLRADGAKESTIETPRQQKGSNRTRSRPQPAPARPAALFPPLHEILDPRGPFFVPLLMLVVARAAFWWLVPLPAEDAYITFRYSRNLAQGLGLVYNPGEHVFGFSSPLWTVWNALGFALTKNPLLWSRLWSIAADACSLLVVGGMLKRHAGTASAWCWTIFFSSWPYFAAVSMSGMEMSVFIALIAISSGLANSRHWASGPCIAALALTRPEGFAAAAVIAIAAGNRDRLIAVALVGAGLAGLWASFGTVIPQSVVAKSLLYGTAGPWRGRHWWEWLSPITLGRWPSLGETSHLVPFCMILGPALVLGVRELWTLRRTSLAVTAAAGLVVWLGYVFVGVAYFWWYLAAPLAAIIMTCSISFPRMVRGPALPVSCLLFVLGIWSIAPKLYTSRYQGERSSFGRAAEYLREHGKSTQKLMLEPIGAVGYATSMVVLDEVGLVTPRVAARRLRGPGWYTDVALAERPDWLVVRSSVLNTGDAYAGAGAPFRSGVERDSLLARYELVDSGDPGAAAASLMIWRRVR